MSFLGMQRILPRCPRPDRAQSTAAALSTLSKSRRCYQGAQEPLPFKPEEVHGMGRCRGRAAPLDQHRSPQGSPSLLLTLTQTGPLPSKSLAKPLTCYLSFKPSSTTECAVRHQTHTKKHLPNFLPPWHPQATGLSSEGTQEQNLQPCVAQAAGHAPAPVPRPGRPAS